MKNKFRIITPSYNNALWLEYNVASVLNQTYANWEWIYIDDCSTDGTYDLVKSLVDDPRVTIIRNETNLGAMWNYFEIGLRDIEDDTIVVHLDGDDWLFDIHVLERLNDYYNQHDVWMTYGKMYVWRGADSTVEESTPQNSPAPEIVMQRRSFREDIWRYSHLRTYRAFLLKAINKDDMIDPVTNEFYWEASDLSFQYPCLEMSAPDKIGCVDFPTYVYNANPLQTSRTSTRQHSSRHWEIEQSIRGKKRYSKGIGLGKLPQVNIHGYQYDSDTIPTKFSIVYNATTNTEYDVTVFTDFDIPKYINNPSLVGGLVIADLHETREFSEDLNRIYDLVYDNYSLFDCIITHDEKLLTLPNAKLRFIAWRTHLYRYDVNKPVIRDPMEGLYCYPKSRQVSCVSSNKAFLPGHHKRLEFVHWMRHNAPHVDMYGRGFNAVEQKLDALRDYRFSVVIENAVRPNWITEKVTDCFITGTIPIYYGAPNIGDYFDSNGILQFATVEELQQILQMIETSGEELYRDKIESVMENFKHGLHYTLTLDKWFDVYIRPIICGGKRG